MRACGHIGGMGGAGGGTNDAPYWFPDWNGQTVVLVASGPSLRREQAEQAQGLKTLAINNSWRMFPNADALYACDLKWWLSEAGRQALASFRGLRITQDARAAEQFGIHRVPLEADDYTISTRPPRIGSGGNGGFQALNLAIHFGARRIILLGYDMHVRAGVHWHGEHGAGLNNPRADHFGPWIRYFEDNAGLIRSLGVEVINCTPGSALTCFTQMPLQAAIT